MSLVNGRVFHELRKVESTALRNSKVIRVESETGLTMSRRR